MLSTSVFFLPGIKPPLGQPLALAKHFYRLILSAVFRQQVPDLLFGLRPWTPAILLPFLFHERALTFRKARPTPHPKKTTGRIITPRNKGKATEIMELLKEQQECGISIQEFCRKKGIPSQRFYGWRKRYAHRLAQPSFVPLRLANNASDAFAEIELRGKLILRIYQPVDASYLKALL